MARSLRMKKKQAQQALRAGDERKPERRDERLTNAMSRWKQVSSTKVGAAASFVMAGKRHTPSSYASFVLRKAQPRPP